MSDELSAEAEQAMEHALRDMRDQLATSTEDDVTAALAESYVAEMLQGIAPAFLLEFFLRMLDERLGPDES